jgi:UDPglucose 6-dehydrogenase
VAQRLLELGAKVRAYDPHAAARARSALTGLIVAGSVEQLAEEADALVLVTDWPEFKALPYEQLAERMRSPIVVDGRNCLDREALLRAGFEYIGIGR